MSRQDLNRSFLETSFLDGTNAAYVEQMQEQYEENPGSVSDEWRHFFESLHEDRKDANALPRTASWAVPLSRLEKNSELISALTGDYEHEEQTINERLTARAQLSGFELSPAASMRATQDSIRALMLIRAYRVM